MSGKRMVEIGNCKPGRRNGRGLFADWRGRGGCRGRLLQVWLQEGTKVCFVGDGVFKAFKKRRLVQRTSTSF